jgi:hypothetical protein
MQTSDDKPLQLDRHAFSSGEPVQFLRRVFSFPGFLVSLLVVLATMTARLRLNDPDMWWHLKLGEIIWKTHSIPKVDLFSFTTNHQASIPQEWLAQLCIYGAYHWGNLTGLMLWLCLVTTALLIAGYLLCSVYSGNVKVAFIGAVMIWFFASVGISIRPQLVGYLFLVVEMLLIHFGQNRHPRWLFGLPVLFLVWVNCHGSFFLGLVVAAILLFAAFFNFQMGSLVALPWNPRSRWMFAIALALSVAALFLNPDGLKLILYPVNTIFHQPLGLANVEEWKQTQITDPRGIGLLALLLCSFLLVIVRRTELYWHELLLLIPATWLGLGHRRLLIVFGILAAPILSRQLSSFWDGYDAEKDRIWPNAVLMGVLLLTAVLEFPNRQSLENQVEKQNPVKAVEFIKTHNLQGPMLNAYPFGGYLIWAMPEHPVFVDGRADVYEWSGVLADYLNWGSLTSDPNLLLQKDKINFCLLSSDSPMVRVLLLLHQWKIIYSDDKSVILVRTPPLGKM